MVFDESREQFVTYLERERERESSNAFGSESLAGSSPLEVLLLDTLVSFFDPTLGVFYACWKRSLRPWIYRSGWCGSPRRSTRSWNAPRDCLLTELAFRSLLVTRSFQVRFGRSRVQKMEHGPWLSRTLSIVQSPTPVQPISNTNGILRIAYLSLDVARRLFAARRARRGVRVRPCAQACFPIGSIWKSRT